MSALSRRTVLRATVATATLPAPAARDDRPLEVKVVVQAIEHMQPGALASSVLNSGRGGGRPLEGAA